MGKKPQVEVTQGSKLWLTSTLKPLDVPPAFLPVLCRLAGSRVFPPLESLGEQQPLRESLVTLSVQRPCEQKPSLANCRFHTLAPGFLEGLSVRHLSICAVNAVVHDDPQKELVVRRPELPVVSVTRGPRHAPVQQSLHGLCLQNRALSLNDALGLSKSSAENFLKHPHAILVRRLMSRVMSASSVTRPLRYTNWWTW